MANKTPPAISVDTIDEALQDNALFRRGVSGIIASALSESFTKPTISQAKAYKLFGRSKVETWKAKGILQERRQASGRIDYFTSDLLEAQRKSFY